MQVGTFVRHFRGSADGVVSRLPQELSFGQKPYMALCDSRLTATGGCTLVINIIQVGSSGNVVRGNFIGTDVTGPVGVGNTRWGVLLSTGAPGNTIGGTSTGDGNTIAHNSGDGVLVSSGTDTAILGNSIFFNTGLGIDLSPGGVSANDAGDVDSGANNLQNFPILTLIPS